MDETMARGRRSERPDGFPGQRLCVIPRPQVEAALDRPGTRHLTVSDAGYFPVARGHRRRREAGAPETIVIVCTAGSGRVCIADQWQTVDAGTCIVIPAFIAHDYHASREDPWTIWWLHLRGSDVEELSTSIPGAPSPTSRLRSLDTVTALFDELLSVLERRPTPAQLVIASGIAWHLLTRIAIDSILPAEGSALERAIRYLETRVDGSISVAALARLVGVSGSHLGALFRQATGGGPAAFHTSVKMARARDLLDTTPMPIGAVAAAVGYADQLYFSRQFHRTHGVSPSAYRAQHKG